MAKDNEGDTPLHLAATEGPFSVLCTLIDEFKCNPNTKDPRAEPYCIMLLKMVMLTLSGSLYVNVEVLPWLKMIMVTLLSTLLPWEVIVHSVCTD